MNEELTINTNPSLSHGIELYPREFANAAEVTKFLNYVATHLISFYPPEFGLKLKAISTARIEPNSRLSESNGLTLIFDLSFRETT